MGNKTILIIEDDITLNKGIMLTLRQNDINIKQAFTLEDSRNILKKRKNRFNNTRCKSS